MTDFGSLISERLNEVELALMSSPGYKKDHLQSEAMNKLISEKLSPDDYRLVDDYVDSLFSKGCAVSLAGWHDGFMTGISLMIKAAGRGSVFDLD